MVSGQIPGVITFIIRSKKGIDYRLTGRSSYALGPGGTSEGAAPANTPEKWNTLPLQAPAAGPGSKIIIAFKPGATKTMDASDSNFDIPIVVNGIVQSLGNPAHASGLKTDALTTELTPSDIAMVGGIEVPIFIGRVNEGNTVQIGGGKVFMSIEDNA